MRGRDPVGQRANARDPICAAKDAGIRFVTELCKMRAFAELWDEICRNRYGVEEAEFRRFRYGVQVNSLGEVLKRTVLQQAPGLMKDEDEEHQMTMPLPNSSRKRR